MTTRDVSRDTKRTTVCYFPRVHFTSQISIFLIFIYLFIYLFTVYISGGRESSVGIATKLQAERFGVRMPVEAISSSPAQTVVGPPSLPYSGYRVSFPGLKRSGCCVDHPPHSRAEVNERVELYLYLLPLLLQDEPYRHLFLQ